MTVIRTLFFKGDTKSQLSEYMVSLLDFYCAQLAVLWKVNKLLISLAYHISLLHFVEKSLIIL